MKVNLGIGHFFRSIFGRAVPPTRHYGQEDLVQYRGGWNATGYRVVRTAARDGQMATPGSGQQHERPDRAKLLDLSRELYRDDFLYSGIINRATDYTVGGGFGLQMRTKNEDWNALVEAWRKRYWLLPEIRQDKSGLEVERMVAKELFRTGEATAVKTNRGTLQLIEAEQLVGVGYREDGIKRDEFGAAVEYSIAPWREYGGVDIARAQATAAAYVLYAFSADRPSSSRGIPPLAPAFSMFRRISDIFDAETLARLIQSRLALSITKDAGPAWATGASKEDPNKTGVEGDIAKRIMLWDAGLVFTGRSGEKIESIDRGAPGVNFEQEITPFLRATGAPLGIPLEFVFMDWTKTNYSQSRAILEQASVTFQRWQALMESCFHRPSFEWALERAIVSGELPTPPVDDYTAHEWIKPAFPWIDALKEAQAYGEQLDRGLVTHAQVLKSRNIDRGDFLEQRDAEVRSAIARSKAIEKETGVKVPWQIFAGQKAEPPAAPPRIAPAPAEKVEESEKAEEAAA